MSEHIVRAYDEQLAELKALITEMGTLVAEQVVTATEVLRVGGDVLAEQAIRKDDAIDGMFREIEDKAVRAIAMRQPVAGDLRQILAAVKIAADLERIGDLAKNTAKRALATGGLQTHLAAVVLPLTERAVDEVRDVLLAFANGDSKAALLVWEHDEDLDDLYNSAFRQLLTYMLENPRNIGQCAHLLFAAKNVERIGDHATNIAENIYYVVEGRPPVGPRPKKETTLN